MIDKIYLKRHLQRREDLKNEIDRYDMLIKDSQLRGINMDGMPHGSASGDNAFYSTLDRIRSGKTAISGGAKNNQDAVFSVPGLVRYP